MNKMKCCVSELNRQITALKNVTSKCRNTNTTTLAGIVVLLSALTVGAALCLPRWIAVLPPVALCAWVLWNIRQKNKADEDNSVVIDQAIDSVEKNVENLMLLAEQLEDLGNGSGTGTTIKPIPPVDPYAGYANIMLAKIQMLDFEVEDFGDDCTKYMRKVFVRTLDMCGLKFVDYSDDHKWCFDTEPSPAINKVNCIRRAIVTKNGENVVIRGRAFIPA